MSSSSCAPTRNPNFFGSARQNGKWGYRATTNNYNTINYIVPSVGAILNGTSGATNGTNTGVSGPFISPVANLPGYTTGSASTASTATSIIQSPLLNGTLAPAYTFGDSPRTAPYGLTGPGNYQLDLAMVRSFPLHITAASKLNFRAEWYNVTNHTLFGVASTVVGNSSFGQVGTNSAANRKAVQFSGRIEF
jgi:hypothetical protein